MHDYYNDQKPYRDHKNTPPITIYIINDDAAKEMDKISCIYCKRTIHDMKAKVINIITTPVPLDEYGVSVNVRCKLCHQNYRLVTNAQPQQ